MLKFESPISPENVTFSEATVTELDFIAASLDTSGEYDNPSITKPTADVLYYVGYSCGRIVLANTHDGSNADAIRESLIVSMNPDLITSLSYGFQNGWVDESLAKQKEGTAA